MRHNEQIKSENASSKVFLMKKATFLLIGTYCALCTIFSQHFVHLHINFRFLDFPVFIGEILLLISLVLAFFIMGQEGILWKTPNLFIYAYFLWIILKAFSGYAEYGPLAFRNAALYYYAAFGLIGYVMYDKRYFSYPGSHVLILILLAIIYFLNINPYFILPYFVLIVILSRRIGNKLLRWLLIILALHMSAQQSGNNNLIPIMKILSSTRSITLGHIAALAFISFFLVWTFWNVRTMVKVIASVVVILCIVAMFKMWPDKNALRSLVSIKENVERYHETRQKIKDREKTFVPAKLDVKLYSKERERGLPYMVRTILEVFGIEITPKSNNNVIAFIGKYSGIEKEFNEVSTYSSRSGNITDQEGNVIYSDDERIVRDQREIGPAYANIYFRILIWEDMLKEMIDKKAFLGISFGQPQRSRSIEILNQASSEWMRDGWITPHNSFLHIIYRAGILGMMYVIVIIAILIYLIAVFLKTRSAIGILLMSIFVYYFVVINFTLFLEFPYKAIPFWSLLGMTFAYGKEKEQELRNSKEKDNV